MKTFIKFKMNPTKGFLGLFLAFFIFCLACKEDPVPYDTRTFTPPDPNLPTKITSYFPDSGGIATKLILYGENFGSDTAYIKVTVNDKKAAVINSDGEAIYAITPRQAGTGSIKVFIGKEPNVKEFTYDNEFKYFFQSNVTTYAGIQVEGGDASEPVDGNLSTATFRRPWSIACDQEAIYVIDEGRGRDKNGGLRRIYQGEVTTIVRNSSGPVQSPAGVVLSLDEDTLFLMNKIYSANDISTTVTIGSFLRVESYSSIRAYVREPKSNTKATGMAVHPISGDLFYYAGNGGTIYMHKPGTEESISMGTLSNVGDDNNERGKGLSFNNDGTILYLVADDRHCIFKADYDAATQTLSTPVLFAGQDGKAGHQDGLGQTAQFNRPSQGTVDQYDNLFVADYDNHCIRKITPEGLVTTYAGIPKQAGYKDGEPETSLFRNPQCVTFNKYDYGLYVADRYNHVIRKIMVE
jgi:hypothetical protein